MEKILLSTLVFSLLYSNVYSAAFPKRTIESFIIHYLEDRKIIPVRVILNSEQQTEHVVTPGGGETLYDFNQGKVAYKDQNSSQCFIADILEESLERDRRKLKNIEHGIVRGFYLPTFMIQQEYSNSTELSEKFGIRLTQFCSGNTVSSVAREQRRSKRDTAGENGQFTHHSYGHYGHQSNNYAHYGHETHITGKVDKDGKIRDQRVSFNQVRSDSSQTYPLSSSGNGPQAAVSDSTSRNNIYRPQYQTQYQIPTSQSRDTRGRPFGTGSSGQFALQTNHESGYQVNLPLGLRAGNAYRGGIHSSGQYGVGGPEPQITAEFQKYPDQTGRTEIPGKAPSAAGVLQPSVPPTQPGIPQVDYTRTRDSRIGTATGVPGYQDLHQRRITQPLPGTGDVGLPSQAGRTRSGDGRYGTSVGVPGYSGLDQTQVTQPGADDIGLRGLPSQVDHTRVTDRGLGVPAGVPGYSGLDQTRVAQPGANGIGLRSQVDHTRVTDRGLGVPAGVPGYSGLDQTRVAQPGAGDINLRGLPSQVDHTGVADRRFGIPAGVPGYRDLGRTGVIHPLPATRDSSFGGFATPVHPDISAPSPSLITDSRHIQLPPGAPGTQTDLRTGVSRPSAATVDRRTEFQSGVSQPGIDMLTSDRLTPDLRIPPSHIPGRLIDSQLGQPGAFTGGIGQTRTQTGLQPPPGIPRPGYQEPSTHPDFLPGRELPSQYLQTRDRQYPVSSQIPGLYQPGLRPDVITRNGISYPVGTYPQIPGGIRQEYPSGADTTAGGIQPTDGRRILPTGLRPEDAQILRTRETGRVVPDSIRGYQVPGTGIVPHSRISTGISPGALTSADRSVLTSQARPGASGVYGQDSASSQTQIQTNAEGTAAEASAAGQYRGLGSQTQVQGGYAGNGSFSAQAQSGFTGGVVQSQVQGSKQGGSSGSSATVERVGAAQSQVQVGQPSGSATSTAQGKFSGGTTQVQAQSGKTGGSAGAQALSTGLSSSNVQVNIGGKEVSEQDRFQGTVSASVQGGHAAGQAQTQLQGGYDSGRTYVATAQGGFDSAQVYQGAVPLAGSLQTPSDQTLRVSQPSLGTTIAQPPGSVFAQRPAVESSGPLVTQTGRGLPGGAQITQPTRTRTFDQRTDFPGVPSSVLTQPLGTLPDQRQLGRFPEQSSLGAVSDRTPASRTPGIVTDTLVTDRPGGTRISPKMPSRDSQSPYPGLTPEIPGHLPQISQPYPSYRPDSLGISGGMTAERPSSTSQQTPGYTAYDQRITLPSGAIPGPQQNGLSLTSTGLPGHHTDRFGPIPPSLPGIVHPGTFIQPSILTPEIPGIPGQIPGIPGYLPQISQPYPGYRPDSLGIPGGMTAERPSSVNQQTPGYTAYDQRITLPSGVIPGSQQNGLSLTSTGLPGHHTDRFGPIPPSLPGIVRPGTFIQPSILAPESPTHLGYPPDFLPYGQQPGFPSSQIPISARPGITGHPDQQVFYPPVIPGQPHISPPHPQTSSPQSTPDDARGVGKPDDSQYTGLPHGTRQFPAIPGQPQISPPRPQDSLTPAVIPPAKATSASVTPRTTQVEFPGAREPDISNCCEALRELQGRCCGRSNGRRNGSSDSSCCRSKADDFSIDFSSEDGLDEDKSGEPCKVVKAICYIVYKPVGKARICKPTDTNGC